MPEPWLRNLPLEGDPVIAAVLFALQQVREDIGAIEVEEVWREIPGIPTLGFQLTHLAGSLNHLTTYMEGRELTDAQLAFLRAETTPGATLKELQRRIEEALQRTEETLRMIKPAGFGAVRYVGRERIPTTVIGLAIHIAEHTQRHCGQAITTAKILIQGGRF
jgi:hypothetical protein